MTARVVTQALLETLGEPFRLHPYLSRRSRPVADPNEWRAAVDAAVDMVIDGGFCGMEPTTVVDRAGKAPQLVRQGKGTIEGFGLES